MRIKARLFFFVSALMLLITVGCSVPPVIVSNLRVEMQDNPIGLTVQHPRFSWQISSPIPDLIQRSYRIQVATSVENLNNGDSLIWDSGNIASEKCVLVPYSGKPLVSNQRYYWHVRVNANHRKGQWSKISSWTTALFDQKEWKASWIEMDSIGQMAIYFRKEFFAKKGISHAYLYISGIGLSEAYLNGRRIGDNVLSPTVSTYSSRIYYNMFDVSDFVSIGRNALAVVVGKGTLGTKNKPRLLAQLFLDYSNGNHELVLSDTTWHATIHGPIIANDLLQGEEYDARLEIPGWNNIDFNDAQWSKVKQMPVSVRNLSPQTNPNICIHESIRPASAHLNENGNVIIDMGQNMSGWLSVKLKAKTGVPIKIRYAERLAATGDSLDILSLYGARQTDIYIPANDGTFNWEPKFTIHGFRYVEISGLDYLPNTSDFIGQVVSDRMNNVGSFNSSDALLNRLYRNAWWGIRSNYRGMPLGCPQRADYGGSMVYRGAGCIGESFLFDNALLYNKWEQDIYDLQRIDGAISDISPSEYPTYSGKVIGQATYFYVAEMLYRQYGDKNAILRYYSSMKRYLRYVMSTEMNNFIIVKDKFGDPAVPSGSVYKVNAKDISCKTDDAIISSSIYYDLLQKMIYFARVLDKDGDVTYYRTLASKMKSYFNREFFHASEGFYGNNTATANILSLQLGLVPKGAEKRVFRNIVKNINGEKDHICTGLVGLQHLMRVLTEGGKEDLAYQIAKNITYPSWGYMVEHDATSFWESWSADSIKMQTASMNHVSLIGDLLIWYYEDLAGIKCASNAVGFKRLLMRPYFPKGLDYVNASYRSIYGLIKSSWMNKNGRFRWKVTIPGNTSAVIQIPKSFNVDDSYQKGMHSSTISSSYTEFEIGSGTYVFTNYK